MSSAFVDYIKDSYKELFEKVSWPKWSDLQKSTTVVAIATVIVALVLFGVDSLFSNFVKAVLGFLIKD